jgi:hypothetical protein
MGSSAWWHPPSLKFCIAPTLGPLRQNSIKVFDWTQRLLPEEESGSTRPSSDIGHMKMPASKLPLIVDANPLLGAWKLKSYVVASANGRQSLRMANARLGKWREVSLLHRRRCRLPDNGSTGIWYICPK